ncbi:MAG: putative lipid II flippase FtsW [bacterium]
MKKNIDYKLLMCIVLLSVFGVIMIYSASHIWAMYKFNDAFKFVKSQGTFLILGIFVALTLSNIDYNFFKKYSKLIFFIALALLILVLIPGIGIVRNGSRSWFGIGSLGVQPSEFAKIAIIIYSSYYLDVNKVHNNNKIKNIIPLLGIIVFVFLLIMLEPDFGTGFVIILTNVLLIYISGIDVKFFFKIGALASLALGGLIIAAPYRLARITSFLDPWSDPLGSGFQIIQSLYAIGPGGLLGQGFLSSRQKNFYLPEPQTDFIFSIISEEFGFLGVLIVTLFFFYIFFKITQISLRQEDLFAKYLSFGIGSSLLVQATLNLSVVTGLLPITGITLPFISYGGSSLLISFAMIGIVLNISRN